MARTEPGGSLSIPEISRAEGLSIPNVAKLMRLLRLGGFVLSVRGQAGGYTLARPAEQITVSQVLELLGGSLFGPNFCQRHAGVLDRCSHANNCPVRCLWSSIHKSIQDVLSCTTLRDLLCSEAEMRQRLEAPNGYGHRKSAAASAHPAVCGTN